MAQCGNPFTPTPMDAYTVAVGNTVFRYDSHPLGSARKDSRGFLRVPANLTRTGVMEYMRADGTTVLELRPEEEVFKADSLATLEGAPVTSLHPKGPVTPGNVRDLRVGGVSGSVRRDGRFVVAALVVEDEGEIARVDSGESKEISCGYRCRIDVTPGTTPEGERYDQIQRDITYNHVAIGPEGWGRAGREVALRADGGGAGDGLEATWRFDAGDAVLISEAKPASTENPAAPPDGGSSMPTIRMDGKSFEAPEATADAVHTELERRDGLLKEATDKASSEAARADAAEDKAKKAETALEAVNDPKARQDAVKARLGLERSAATVLGETEKLDALSDAEVRAKVLAKACPDLKLDDKDAVYIQGRYDAAVEVAGKTDKGLQKSLTAVELAKREDGDDERVDAGTLIDKRRNRFKDYMNPSKEA